MAKSLFLNPLSHLSLKKGIFIVVCIRRVEVIWRRIYQPWHRCVSIQLKNISQQRRNWRYIFSHLVLTPHFQLFQWHGSVGRARLSQGADISTMHGQCVSIQLKNRSKKCDIHFFLTFLSWPPIISVVSSSATAAALPNFL